MFHKSKHKKLHKRELLVVLLVFVLSACSQPASVPEDPSESGVPTTPTNLTAVAGNAQVTLNWSANAEEDLAHYNVFQGTARGDLLKVAEVPKGTESFVATGLTNNLIHHFALRAETVTGKRSEITEEVSATPQEDAASSCQFDDASTVFGSCTFSN